MGGSACWEGNGPAGRRQSLAMGELECVLLRADALDGHGRATRGSSSLLVPQCPRTCPGLAP